MHFLLGIDWIWQPSHMDRVPVAEAKPWMNTMHAAYLYTKWKEKLCFNMKAVLSNNIIVNSALSFYYYYYYSSFTYGRLDNNSKGRLAFLALGSTTRRCSGCLHEMGDLMAIAVGVLALFYYMHSRSYSSFFFFSLSFSLSCSLFHLLLWEYDQHGSDDMEDALDDEDEFSLPRNAEITGYIDYDKTHRVSMETHIPESNVGYRLLQKMGWREGQGLGSTGQGMAFIYISCINIDI